MILWRVSSALAELISDKLLIKSGSYNVTEKAYKVLEKVATVVNGQPEMDVMIEGHTDDTPIKADNKVLQDNWDLSVKRATSVVKIITTNSRTEPSRLTAAGRGEYVPLSTENTSEARKRNRRIEVILTPKLDELFQILESN